MKIPKDQVRDLSSFSPLSDPKSRVREDIIKMIQEFKLRPGNTIPSKAFRLRFRNWTPKEQDVYPEVRQELVSEGIFIFDPQKEEPSLILTEEGYKRYQS